MDFFVRLVVNLTDGDHIVREVLVCNNFDVAIWGTPYMSEFGFCHWLVHAQGSSMMFTPRGGRVPIRSKPYRLYAPPRRPTKEELLRPPPAPVAGRIAPPIAGSLTGVRDAQLVVEAVARAREVRMARAAEGVIGTGLGWSEGVGCRACEWLRWWMP